MDNFVVIHNNGTCLFNKNYGSGESLDVNMVMGISTCIATLAPVTGKRVPYSTPTTSTTASASAATPGVSATPSTAARSIPSTASETKETKATPATTATNGNGKDTKDSDNKDSKDVLPAATGEAPPMISPSSIMVASHKFVYLPIGPFTLVAEAATELPLSTSHSSSHGGGVSSGDPQQCAASDQYLTHILIDIRRIILWYVGDFHKVHDDASIMKSVLEFVDHHLIRYRTDLATMVSGNRWVVLEEETRDQVDRLLAAIETNENVMGTVLLLGESVIHSRMSHGETRLIIGNITAHPLGTTKLRTIPVFDSGKWRHLIIMRLGTHTMTLAVLINIRAPVAHVVSSLSEFEDALADATLPIPVEEPPVLLRHYTGHDTIAFVYHHLSTGVTIAPAARSGPKEEADRTLAAFIWFFSRACAVLSISSTSELTLRMRGYRFHAAVNDQYILYALYTERVTAATLEAQTRELLDNIGRHHADIIQPSA